MIKVKQTENILTERRKRLILCAMILTTRNFGPSLKTLRGIVYVVFQLRPGCLQVVDHNQKQQGVQFRPLRHPAGNRNPFKKKGKKEITKQLAQESNFKLSSNRVDELFIPTRIY